MEPWTKTCGLPLRSFNFEHPNRKVDKGHVPNPKSPEAYEACGGPSWQPSPPLLLRLAVLEPVRIENPSPGARENAGKVVELIHRLFPSSLEQSMPSADPLWPPHPRRFALNRTRDSIQHCQRAGKGSSSYPVSPSPKRPNPDTGEAGWRGGAGVLMTVELLSPSKLLSFGLEVFPGVQCDSLSRSQTHTSQRRTASCGELHRNLRRSVARGGETRRIHVLLRTPSPVMIEKKAHKDKGWYSKSA